MAADNGSWLIEALRAVNDTYDQLGIKVSDFEPSEFDYWEPLPIDREEPHLRSAIEKLDEAIEQVRADNGYSSTVPEERAYVLEKLSALSKRLKTEATISWMYLNEFGLKPLGQLTKRFGKAAVGLAAVAARDSLLAWLKAFGAKALDFLMRNPPF